MLECSSKTSFWRTIHQFKVNSTRLLHFHFKSISFILLNWAQFKALWICICQRNLPWDIHHSKSVWWIPKAEAHCEKKKSQIFIFSDYGQLRHWSAPCLLVSNRVNIRYSSIPYVFVWNVVLLSSRVFKLELVFI